MGRPKTNISFNLKTASVSEIKALLSAGIVTQSMVDAARVGKAKPKSKAKKDYSVSAVQERDPEGNSLTARTRNALRQIADENNLEMKAVVAAHRHASRKAYGTENYKGAYDQALFGQIEVTRYKVKKTG